MIRSRFNTLFHSYALAITSGIGAAALALTANAVSKAPAQEVPADKFDLNQWKITLPLDDNNDGKVDEIDVRPIQKYSHPDFFYLDENGYMVFAAPNSAKTTSGSTNTRSELRQMPRGKKTSIKTSGPKNNFAVAEHPKAEDFSSIGGKMSATLKVDHVSKNAKYSEKYPAYSVVIGQIHAGKAFETKLHKLGFGWGNEPLKIYYKKWPNHEKGSVFWTYERNLAKTDPKRVDIAYPVWGQTWEFSDDPGEEGVALGEEFSYEVNVRGNIMQLLFSSPTRETIEYRVNLANNIDPYGQPDKDDLIYSYSGDWMYFKAGAYNQCSVKDQPGFWYAACAGTGDWDVDKKNGDYTQVSFSKLELGESTQLSKTMAKTPKKRMIDSDVPSNIIDVKEKLVDISNQTSGKVVEMNTKSEEVTQKVKEAL